VCRAQKEQMALEKLKDNILKQIHKYSGCGKDCRSMNIPLRANVV